MQNTVNKGKAKGNLEMLCSNVGTVAGGDLVESGLLLVAYATATRRGFHHESSVLKSSLFSVCGIGAGVELGFESMEEILRCLRRIPMVSKFQVDDARGTAIIIKTNVGKNVDGMSTRFTDGIGK